MTSPPSSDQALRPADKKKVLLVRVDAIGDFVIWLDAARALRNLYPAETHHITLLANRDWSDLAAQLPLWDAVWPIDRGRFGRRRSLYSLRMQWRLFSSRFDIAIQPTYSREKNLGDLAIRVTRARERIGSAGDMSNTSARKKARADKWYTRLVPAMEQPLSEWQRNAEFVKGLGAGDVPHGPSPLAELSSRVSFASAPSKPYFVMVPGTRVPIKRWPAENFGDVAERIFQRTGWMPVLCGSADERDVGLAAIGDRRLPYQNLMGETTLLEMLPLLRGAKLLVANDTAAVHMAAAVGTPTVVVAGGGHWGRFLPYPADARHVRTVTRLMPCFNCNWRCIYPRPGNSAAPCVRDVTVDMVWSKVLALMGNAG